jgi:polysaccharide deacetylase family protein (PEP-CTERM system associated)
VTAPLRILTVDFEDWFHILDHSETRYPEQWSKFDSRIERNVHRLLELFDQHNVRATWFCLGWSAIHFPRLVQQIAAHHEIACHTFNHQLLYHQSPDEFIEDALKAKHTLEDITGNNVDTFRAAGFSVTNKTPWFFESVRECDFTVDSSVFTARRNHGGIPQFGKAEPCIIKTSAGELLELPLPTARFGGINFPYSGGGYFRLLPYSWIKHAFGSSVYTMTYFHPRDIDPDQPMIASLPIQRKFMSYYGLRNCYPKLDRLLGDFSFATVNDAVRALQNTHLPVRQIFDND